jgi:transcription initiation factor TFIID subunit TAF12
MVRPVAVGRQRQAQKRLVDGIRCRHHHGLLQRGKRSCTCEVQPAHKPGLQQLYSHKQPAPTWVRQSAASASAGSSAVASAIARSAKSAPIGRNTKLSASSQPKLQQQIHAWGSVGGKQR